MNKLLKGSIAGAAGIALLLGGAGTFALWNDSAATAGGTVTTGTMAISDTAETGVWTDESGTKVGAEKTLTPGTQTMVPGDVWRFTKTVAITASGKNLFADLTFDPKSVPSTATDAELTYAFGATSTNTSTLAPITTGTILANTKRFAPVTSTGGTTKVTITFTISYTDVSAATATPVGNAKAGQAKSIDLKALTFTLTQVRP